MVLISGSTISCDMHAAVGSNASLSAADWAARYNISHVQEIPMKTLYAGVALAGILILVGVLFVKDPFSAGDFAKNYFAAGDFVAGIFAAGTFAVGLFAAGTFAVGVFSIGIFSIGIFSLGLFSIGVYSLGFFVLAKYRKTLSEKT
jgi:hypothetical protein